MPTEIEKRKTLNNKKNEILNARIVANYGDPGLSEDYHFDILSRYVIVMIESCDRVLTSDKWFNMLAVVKRPETLWIKTEGGVAATTASQQRSDYDGNINKGLAASPSVNGIPPINRPYQLGDFIKIRKVQKDLADSQFSSSFTNWDSQVQYYGTWHSQGASLPYFANYPNRISKLRIKTINPTSIPGSYNFAITKFQYEAFMLSLNLGDNIKTLTLSSIFDGSWTGKAKVYSANGGYAFASYSDLYFSNILYEDINFDNRIRESVSECIPIVVTTPNSFPMPKSRSPGLISYNPSYSPILK